MTKLFEAFIQDMHKIDPASILFGFIMGLFVAMMIFEIVRRQELRRYHAALKKSNDQKNPNQIELIIKANKDVLYRDMADLDMSMTEYGNTISNMIVYPWVQYAKGLSGAQFFVKDKLFTVYVTKRDANKTQFDA